MNNDKNDLTKAQLLVLEQLKKGESNKINLKTLAHNTNLSKREVGYVIAELRQFYPICSTTLNGGGLWIADCNKDIIDFTKKIQRITHTYQLTINYMEGHIK